jgi:hypothetical protein
VALHFVNIVFCLFLVSIRDSIAQQQGTEAAKEFLAARRGRAIPHGA